MPDIWVCGDCKSINPMRSSRCYKCHAPRPAVGQELTAVDAPLAQRSAVDTALGVRARHHTALVAIVVIGLSC